MDTPEPAVNTRTQNTKLVLKIAGAAISLGALTLGESVGPFVLFGGIACIILGFKLK